LLGLIRTLIRDRPEKTKQEGSRAGFRYSLSTDFRELAGTDAATPHQLPA